MKAPNSRFSLPALQWTGEFDGISGRRRLVTRSWHEAVGARCLDEPDVLQTHEVTKPYEFIGFGAMEVTKPYKFIGLGPWRSPNLINL